MSMRVLVVDDDARSRVMIGSCLRRIEGVEIVSSVGDGKAALRRAADLKPDVVLLDLAPSGMDGIELLRGLLARQAGLRVVAIAGADDGCLERAVEALQAGAEEVLPKPAGRGANACEEFYGELAGVLAGRKRAVRGAQAARASAPRRRGEGPGAQEASGDRKRSVARVSPLAGRARPAPASRTGRPDVLAIGSSTGGPEALGVLLRALPAGFPLPVVLTQHMPKLFLESLATRLDRATRLHCRVAADGDALRAGQVLIAPGDVHMEIESAAGGLRARLVDGPRVNHCKPAVDPMFESLARLAPGVRTLAVVLTGMGSDGAQGALAIARAGGHVIAQDEASSTVWGMPGATVKAGAAHEVLPLEKIASAILARAGAPSMDIREAQA